MKNKVDRLRKISLKIGKFNIHIDLLGVVAFIALGLCSWSLAAVKSSVDKEHQDRTNLESAIRDARYHDCLSGNITRKALRDVVAAPSVLTPSETKQLVAKLKLSPSVLKQAETRQKFELQTLAPRNCSKYANQANPKTKRKK